MPARQRRAGADGGGAVVALHGDMRPGKPHKTTLGAVAEVPDGINAAHWQSVIAVAPWLKVSDGLVVKALCDALTEYEQAKANVDDQGVMVLTSTGSMVPNPWYKVMTDRRSEVVSLSRELGLSPKTRLQLFEALPYQEREALNKGL